MARRTPVSLTKLEGDVMQAVWDLAGPVRVREVADALNARRDTPLAYTTIQTMLTILRDKGVVEQTEGSGRAYLYSAKVSREQASRHMVRELADRLFDGRVEPLLMQLIGQARLTAPELRELREWVDARLRDAKEKAT